MISAIKYIFNSLSNFKENLITILSLFKYYYYYNKKKKNSY